MIRVDLQKLREIASCRGFTNLEEIAEEAKRQELKLSMATIYNIANNQNWTRDKLAILCNLLQCSPTDFLVFEVGKGGDCYTHVSPQPDEEDEQVTPEVA